MNNTNKPTTYETIWRNKWTTSEATSIDEMIGALMYSIEELQEMKRDGIEGDFEGAGDDYIFFRTTDPELAKKYHMNEMEDFGDDEDIDEDEMLDDQTSDSE